MFPIEVGAIASVEVTVSDRHLAAILAEEPGEEFPRVFSTPWLLAELERAAAKLLRPLLTEGQISVGVRATVEHVAPTAAGGLVRAFARYTGLEQQSYQFEVWAEDDAGIIGKGLHARAIVPMAAVEKSAQKRLSGSTVK